MAYKTVNTLTILYLIESAGGGGAENVVATLASAYREHAVVGTLRLGWLRDKLDEDAVKCIKLPYSRRSDLLLAIRIAKLARNIHADIIHCNCFTMNTVGALGAILAGMPSIGTVHGMVYDLGTLKRCLAYRAAGSMHRKIVTVSRYLRHEFHRSTGVPLDRIIPIYNGVSDPPPDLDDRNRIRSEFGFGGNDLVVGTVGMLRPEKGHTDLIDAFKLALRDAPDMKLLIAGDGRCREELVHHINALNLNKVIQLAGFRSDVPAILRAMDIFILPSRTEGLSIATIEAMNCGIPVIATDCGGPSEIISDNVSGLLVPPGNPEAMASALLILASDKNLREYLAINGHARARSGFSMDKMILDYGNLYSQILGRD